MKTITISSDIFANEWAESFLKALMGNNEIIERGRLHGFDYEDEAFPFITSEGWKHEIIFNLDELIIDWACLYEFKHWITKIEGGEGFSNSGAKRVLNLDYLAKQKGIEIK
jgi:hypothetical protein